MILIFTTRDFKEKVELAIKSQPRLDELVLISDKSNSDKSIHATHISIDEQGMNISPDWYNAAPPILFPTNIPFDENALLGIVFSLLGNFEKASSLLKEQASTWQCATVLYRLMSHQEMDETSFPLASEMHAQRHNKAIAYQYGNWPQEKSIAEITSAFNDALSTKAPDENRGFTAKHFAAFLTDIQQQQQAVQLLESFLNADISADARTEIKSALCSAMMKELTVPYDPELLEKLKATLWECIQHYESKNRHAELALLLIDASHVANISNSFSESLGYINKAIGLLQSEQLHELVGTAQLQKGMLLYTWAQNGQPQFYRTALSALQEALLLFNRESAPDVFAHIHHHLGVIYSNIQDEVKKKALWAAVSVSSFNEALQFYNKVDYPYEFAMICHNFGNAYTKYPAALHSDNFDKALAWYREALSIRSAEQYPLERSNTLFNYLETSWHTANPSGAFNEQRYDEMCDIATELMQLSNDESLRAEAAEHLEQLLQLRSNEKDQNREAYMADQAVAHSSLPYN